MKAEKETGEVEQAAELVQDAPLTQEAAKAQLRLIADRAKAAGLNPLRILIDTYIERVKAVSAGLLAGLEGDASPKGRK